MRDPQIVQELGGFIAFVSSIYWLLLGYGTAFLAVPAVRYFWIQRKNSRIVNRNEDRQSRAVALNQAPPEVQDKIEYARQFASQTVVSAADLAYTTEKDLTEQEAENRDKLDAEWLRRLNASDPNT